MSRWPGPRDAPSARAAAHSAHPDREVDRRSITRAVAALGIAGVTAGLPSSELLGTGASGGRPTAARLDPTGRTDSGPVLQALYDSGVRVVDLEGTGTYLLDTPVFLDDPDPFDCFVVRGNGAEVRLGERLGRTTAFTPDGEVRWAVFPNTRRDAFDGDAVLVDTDHRATGERVGGTPRLVVDQLVVDGQGEQRAFAFFNRCAGRLSEVVMRAARTLVSWADYCDAMVLDHCQGRVDEVDDAWLVYQVAHGDGLLLLSPKTERGIGAASLDGCRGAVISSAVSGRLRISRSRAITIVSAHAECDLGSTTAVTVRSSHVIIDASLVYPARSTVAPAVVVDDSDAGLGSHVVLRDVGETVFHRDGSATVRRELQGDAVTAPMVALVAVQPATRVVVERAHTRVATAEAGSRWLPSAGYSVVSSVPEVAGALASPAGQWQLATGSWELVLRDEWRVLPTGGTDLAAASALRAPVLVDARGSVDGVTGALQGQVEYAAAMRDAVGAWTEVSRQLSAQAGEDGSVRLLVRISGPGVLVLWRRRGEGVLAGPEVYLQVPVHGPDVVLYDRGQHVGGMAWSGQDVPVPATVAAVNATRTVLLAAGQPLAQPVGPG